jgi:hypothetical protein
MPLQIVGLWLISAACLLVAGWGLYSGNALAGRLANRSRNPVRFWATVAAQIFVGVGAATTAMGYLEGRKVSPPNSGVRFTVTHDLFYLFFYGLVTAYLIAIGILGNRLKRYPDAWEAAGRFSLVRNNTPAIGWLFLKFVFSDGYQVLQDRKIELLVWAVRVLLISGIAILLYRAMLPYMH